ncbi:hypothetical protein U2S04_003011 [Escherichia coli]|jgi:hypothetical protein|uniref:hypothetical protein n=1 Tax=Escherichia coli TaxID=562 RepID=UPI000B429428|nr:hypothetical protein [Escherichia coli]DAY92547.1 MAG TPA: hypothetical protein [Caudoviricetes sp.]EKD5786649.1 hypothetical protein [Escherichia coli]EMA3285125.1 hypothetical protein [Escherichia coli]MDN4877942.1 hypothetical protein [Escherichia coli]OWE57282.1 hypothetical protein A8M63_08990 [Escherichia coli]
MELKIWQAIDVVDNALSMFATNGKRVVIATWTRNHDDIVFRRKAAEWLFSDNGYTMNIMQLSRMKDEKLVDSYTTA